MIMNGEELNQQKSKLISPHAEKKVSMRVAFNNIQTHLDQSIFIKSSEPQIQIKPCLSTTNASSNFASNRDQQKNENIQDQLQVCKTEGNEEKKKSRKPSQIERPQQSEKCITDINESQSKTNKQKIEYDKVKQFLVQAYTGLCEEEGEMELISMPVKRATKKKRKKTPIQVEKAFKEEKNKKQMSDVFQYTIIDNKKKKQEIKLKQKLVNEYTDSTVLDYNMQISNIQSYNQTPQSIQTPLSKQIPQTRQQKSYSLNQNSNQINRNNSSNMNLNTKNNLSSMLEVQDTIIIEDSYPLEWDPGFNKKTRKKLEYINQTRSNNTLPLLDISNVKNLEKYRHVLKRKQGWQPLLNTPFLPVSPQNQVSKADLFKNLQKEQNCKVNKQRTPVKTISRLRGRLISLQNEWGKYNQENISSNEVLNEDVVILEEKTSNLNKLNCIKNEIPSKVIEVDEENIPYEILTNPQPFQIHEQEIQTIDEIDIINQSIQMIASKVPLKQTVQNPKQTLQHTKQTLQILQRDIKTANRQRLNCQTVQSPVSHNNIRSCTQDNQTLQKFYQYSSNQINLKQESLFERESIGGTAAVSRSHEFYNSNISPNNQNRDNIYINNAQNNKIINSNTHQVLFQEQGKATPQLECLSNKDIINIQYTKDKKLLNKKKQNIYLSYYDQQQLNDGSYEQTVNPDLQETIRVQQMQIQEQKLKQQLNLLRSQEERTHKLDSSYNIEIEEKDIQKKTPKTPARGNSRIEERSFSRKNNRSLTISSQNQNSIPRNNSIRQPTITQQQSTQSSFQQQQTLSNTLYTSPISQSNGVTIQQQHNTLKRFNQKSPINKSIIVKDNLSPHQRIYQLQGSLTNNILSQKQQNPQINFNQINNTNSFENTNREQFFQQTFSSNMHQTKEQFKFEYELTEEQDKKIQQLQKQFDDIIKFNLTKPKKSAVKTSKYVQQSII